MVLTNLVRAISKNYQYSFFLTFQSILEPIYTPRISTWSNTGAANYITYVYVLKLLVLIADTIVLYKEFKSQVTRDIQGVCNSQYVKLQKVLQTPISIRKCSNYNLFNASNELIYLYIRRQNKY